MKIKNRNVLVFGLGVSGRGAINLLLKNKAKVFLFDENLKFYDENKNVEFVRVLDEEFLKKVDLIVVNPSVSVCNSNLILARTMNKKIIGEIELAYLFKKGKIISVTGTNGKSTTVSLIYHILNFCKQNSFLLVGNIGTSFAQKVSEDKKANFVCEVSSFQLETIDKFNSEIACFLNFSENHLDRHFSIKEYLMVKSRIFENQTEKDYAILNFDDEKVKDVKTKAKKYYFSLSSVVKGTFFCGEKLYFFDKECEEILCEKDIKLLGKHNKQNVLCAVLVCKLLGIENENIRSAVSCFYGLNHRLKFVRKIGKICFYNDSKSTTVSSTKTALECFENDSVLLILGGSDKNCDYSLLFPINNCVKKIFLIGEVKEKIKSVLEQNGFLNFLMFDDFQTMVSACLESARHENLNVVLLSPASASFDMFKNFEHRGEVFENLVGLIDEKD